MNLLARFLVVIIVGLLISSCANKDQFLKALGSPATVQWDITTVGQAAYPRVSDKGKAAIHKFALDLLAAGDLDMSQLVALIPVTGDASADALIASAVSYLNSLTVKLGSHNKTTLAYIKAVGNGLLGAGF